MIPENNRNSIVYLIGAGPGDPGLITVKGKRILQNCEVVIYDNLIPDELVVTLPSRTEKYYVGKKAGKSCYSQNEINELMVRLASEGKTIARLKGSDPLIFGRGGEEAKYLKKHNIKFEIIPGVTAGVAVPAYSGIPCTDRNLASFVLFVTGHKAREKEYSTVPWDWVAKAKSGTVVIYMGVGEIENIVGDLIKHGMSPETPASVIERGTFPTQKSVSSSLQQLPDAVKLSNIYPPSIFVIGDVVNLQPLLEWFKDKPLLGKRIMVTRAATQAQEFYNNLRDLGAEVQPYPTIGIKEYIDSDGWKSLVNISTDKRWLIFTSENGVNYFFKQYIERIGDIRKLSGFKIAAIGTGTTSVLLKYGLKADFIPSNATADDLGREMKSSLDLQNTTVVRVRGNLAGDTIEKYLAETGAEILPLTVYHTYYPKWPDGFAEKLFEYPPDAIIFTSSSTVKGLFNNLNEGEVNTLTTNSAVFSIGPSTSRTIEEYGLKVTVESKPHNLAELTNRILLFFQAKQGG